MSGLVLIWVALLGPFGALDDTFFWAHMSQHLILTMLAAPLLVLGEPVLMVLRLSPRDTRRKLILPVLRSRFVRILTDPIVTWVLFAAVVLGTHFSPFYDYSLNHAWAHQFIEHPLFLGAALLYFYPLLGNSPGPNPVPPARRVVSLALMMAPEAFTGFFIYSTPYVMYRFYASTDRPFGPGPLADQQLGGALMWSSGMLLDTAWLVLAAHDWLRADARRTRRIDAAVARDLSRPRIRFL